MFCHHCGCELPVEANFCFRCGTPTIQDVSAAAPLRTDNSTSEVSTRAVAPHTYTGELLPAHGHAVVATTRTRKALKDEAERLEIRFAAEMRDFLHRATTGGVQPADIIRRPSIRGCPKG